MVILKKILFTDLYGTLISSGTSTSTKYYNSREREMDIVINYINDFLMDDNYVVIITSPGVHDFFGQIFNTTLVTLHTRIAPSLRSKIIYYMQGDDKIFPEDNIIKKNINGKRYYFGNQEVFAVHIDKKEEAITDFLQRMQLPYQLYAIGDSAKDIPMLLKVQELGGKSSFIDMSFYRQNITSDEIIKNELYVEFHFKFQKILNTRTMDEKLNGISEKEIFMYQEMERRKQQLYKLLYEEKLDLQRLDKNYRNFIECINYQNLNDDLFSKGDKFYENYPFSDNLVKDVVDMSCYPSFADYYTRVLKKF